MKWSGVKWCDVKWREVGWSEVILSEVTWSEVELCDVKWRDVEWSDVKWSDVKWRDVKWSDVIWSEVNLSVWFAVASQLIRLRQLCNTGGAILTEQNRFTSCKAYPSATLPLKMLHDSPGIEPGFSQLQSGN